MKRLLSGWSCLHLIQTNHAEAFVDEGSLLACSALENGEEHFRSDGLHNHWNRVHLGVGGDGRKCRAWVGKDGNALPPAIFAIHPE